MTYGAWCACAMLIVSACKSARDAPAPTGTTHTDGHEPLRDAGVAVELFDLDDAVLLTITSSSTMPAPCERTNTVGAYTATTTVDLRASTIAVERVDPCGVRRLRRGALTAPARAELRALLRALDAPDGGAFAPDAARHTLSIVRGDGGGAYLGRGDIDDRESQALAVESFLYDHTR